MKTTKNLAASQVLVLLLTASVVYPTHGGGPSDPTTPAITTEATTTAAATWVVVDSKIETECHGGRPTINRGSMRCPSGTEIVVTKGFCLSFDDCDDFTTSAFSSCPSADRTSSYNWYCSRQSQRDECDVTCTGNCPGEDSAYFYAEYDCLRMGTVELETTTEATTTAAATTTVAATTAAATTAGATRVVVDSKIETECHDGRPTINRGSMRCPSGTEIVVTKAFCLSFDECDDFTTSAFSSCPSADKTSAYNGYCSSQSQRNECDLTCTGSCPGEDSAYFYTEYDCVRVGPEVLESTTEASTTTAATTAATTITAAATRAGMESKIDFFPCSGSNMSVSTTLVCDGYYDCDNYEDESLCTLITCSSSKKNISSTVLCDGFYHCDHYEDELACNNSAIYLQEDESHFIYMLQDITIQYNATFLQTNATNGFRIVFHDFYVYSGDVKVQIGTGNDPSDNQSVITTIHGYTNPAPDDVFVGTNAMWFAVIGAKVNTFLAMDVEIISIENACLSAPCLNGGTCQLTEIGYQCICMDPFIDPKCEIAICQNISWISPRFEEVEFPVGENGTWANSTGVCPFNTTQANEPIGRALCIGDGITQSQWQPVDNCGPFRNVTDILTEIAEVIVGEENAVEVSQQVSSVTSNIEDITSDDISFVAEITSNIVQQNLTSEEVTESITSIVSNIAQVETEELEAAEEEGGAITKFVQDFEEQISRVEVADGGMLNIQQPNVAVQVQSVLTDDVMSGLVLTLAGSSLSDLTKSNITISAPTQDDRDNFIATRPDIIAQVNIPPSVSSVISSTAPFSGSPSNGSGEYVRVNFNVFSTSALFISKSLRTISADNEGFNRSANSPVISLNIGQGKVAALTEFINFTFSTIMSGYMNPMCSFWDEEQEDWSQDGCVLVSGITSSDERYDEEGVRCACDHLTNFAVIMDIHGQEDPLAKEYKILTYIGCFISIFSLLVTLATYLLNKDLRTKQTNQIFICLCLTLLCLYTTFVIMISLDSTRDYREVQAGPCGFLTALVHYFVLSSIVWMGVEGYNTYLIIVKIFNTYIQNFMIKAFLAAWGLPALIVVLTGAIARDSYSQDDLCFLQFWAQIGGLLIPMSAILLTNIVIFILVVRQLLWSANIAGRVKGEAKAERRETIERVQNAICILLLFGLTWVTGYLLLFPSFTKVAQPIFIVLNSFQGFFIFLLYCIRKPYIRKEWGLTCFDKFLKKEASTSSGAVSSEALSSSAGMISKLRPGASGNYLMPFKDDNPDPLCTFNPTYDVGQVEEGITPSMNNDTQISTEEQKKDTDRDATSTDVVLDASVTNITKGGDGVSSTTDADTVRVILDSTNASKATEGTDDVASTNNDAAVSLPKDAEERTRHDKRSDDAVTLPMDSTYVNKGN